MLGGEGGGREYFPKRKYVMKGARFSESACTSKAAFFSTRVPFIIGLKEGLKESQPGEKSNPTHRPFLRNALFRRSCPIELGVSCNGSQPKGAARGV